MSRKTSSSALCWLYRSASSTGSPASRRFTKFVPFTTRPASTSRHGITRLRCIARQGSGATLAAMRRLLYVLFAAAALALPAAANADQPTVLGKIPCAAQSDGTRFCEGSVATRVSSFDGQPLDVNVALPKTDGPAPLILILHGYGGSKKGFDAREAAWLPTAHELAQRGYAVLNPSDRGFGDSCGTLTS